jgi:hypothetical protein
VAVDGHRLVCGNMAVNDGAVTSMFVDVQDIRCSRDTKSWARKKVVDVI